MASKSRPFALGFFPLLLTPYYAVAVSPWMVNDGTTLQVTSEYYSTEADDIPLQVSGAGSEIVTDNGLSFSTSGALTPVARVTDGGSLTLNNAALSAQGTSSSAVVITSGTLAVTGGSLAATGATINAKDSNINLINTSVINNGGNEAIKVAGGMLTADNLTLSSIISGITIDSYEGVDGEVSINNANINLSGTGARIAIDVFQGSFTGSDITISSASQQNCQAIKVGHNGETKSTLTLSDSTISVNYGGILAMKADVELTNVNVTTNNFGSYALSIVEGSNAVVRGGTYMTNGKGSYSVYMGEATLDAANASFMTTGELAHALNAYRGDVTLADVTVQTWGKQSYGMLTRASIVGENVTVITSGEESYGAYAQADNVSSGVITLTNSHITTLGDTAYGVIASRTGELHLTNTEISTKATGAYILGSLTLNDSSVKTSGPGAYSVWAKNGGSATLTGSTLVTEGKTAYGVAASSSGSVTINGSEITASGDESAGLYAGSSATINADNVTVTASGDNAFGMLAVLGNYTISNSVIANTGTATPADKPGAVGLYATSWSDTLKSTVALDNTTLSSEAGTGVLVKGSALDLSLDNNTLVYGGNGTAVSVLANETDDGTVLTSTVNVTADNSSQLLGDIIVDSYDSPVSLTLANSSTLNGATQNVNQLILNSASSWLVTADSNLKNLALNSGSVIFNNASGYSTVTVDGDLTGSGAFYFNTQLGDDSSLSDKLLVSGDASGAYDVTISNRGGMGALTNSGILLVSVAGDASAAEFNQKNTLVAGNYQYLLNKVGENNWYLQSSLTPVDPGESTDTDVIPDPDPAPAPSPGVKAYRPETAGYLVAPYLNSAYGFDTIGAWHERLDAYQQGTAWWARVSGRHDSYDAGRFAFNVNSVYLQLGGDLVRVPLASGWHLTAGPLMTLGHQRSENKDTARSLRSELSVDVGKIDTTAYGLGGYLTAWHDSGAYLDNVVQVTRYSNNFSSLTNAKMDSYGVVASVETGIPLSLGGQLKIEPQLQAMGQYMNISQTYASDVKLSDQNKMVAQLREGIRLYYDNPVLKPYLQADVVQMLGHTPGIEMNDEKMTPDVRRNYWQAGAGISSQLNPHFSVYAQVKYSHSFGAGTEGYTGNLGMRYKF
ncbi:autotransporter outer membrane beta-barrel domain-containing protein [Kalamiella sp. sgz302252]|uniref:autotransporter outer membrane beta-barrel domain-containing protein n=1 Tax=Pantoea sp. sgz302252 TaxID=3341827 RepID=UPI0036D20B45